jgi:uncharacterized delta-60 repeat protein
MEDRCLLSAGALDPTFGSGGLVSGINVSNATQAYANAVVVQTDGKTVSGGLITVNGTPSPFSTTTRFALERYNTDGTPDSAFGTNGVVQTVVGVGQSFIQGLALQSDGKIVAVGYAQVATSPVVDTAFAVARYNPNGTLDTTFGSGGIVLTNVVPVTRHSNSLGYPGVERATSVAIQGDGKIDVGGWSCPGSGADSSEFTLVRYNANGTLDKTFGSSKTPGIVVTPAFGSSGDFVNALALQSDGKILEAGATSSNLTGAIAVARYTSTGQLDSSFGNNGVVIGLAPPGAAAAANGILVQNGGAVVLAGTAKTTTSDALVMARLTSAGHLDTTFGSSNTGFATISNMVYGDAIARAPNGDLLAAGTAGTWGNWASFDFGIAAFLPNGTPDTTFGTGGVTVADFSGGRDGAGALAIQGDGKIVAAGSTVPVSGNGYPNLALARFLPPDTKIGSFVANPNQVPAGSSVTLTASNILNANPTSTISQVAFYVDANGDGILEPGTDTLLGYGTNNGGTWTFTFTPTTSGTFTLFAQAQDSNGVFSDPVSVALQVM